jgi:UDP-N-acetylglucosamine--N-acetylmuramyl-(pentapeptide) pyrophosphoryl-undecaprenol N-acetylglucosamine transferase
MYGDLAKGFAASGLPGEITPFIGDMPGAFAKADLVICRSGAGTVSELAAAGKPSILVPFPFSADDHQTRNAEVLERGGAAVRFSDKTWTGSKMFESVDALLGDRERLQGMSRAVRQFAHPDSARRAAEILLEEAAKASKSIDSKACGPKQ